MIGTFEITKEEIFAQLFHAITRNFKLVFLRCLAQRLAQKLLRFFGHHALTHFHVSREFPQQRFRRFTRTNSWHIVHMHTDADIQYFVHEQTGVAFNIDSSCVPSICLTGVSAIVSEMFATPTWLSAPSIPHVVRPTEVSVSTRQVARTVVLQRGLRRCETLSVVCHKASCP